jgi:hypothetical protein
VNIWFGHAEDGAATLRDQDCVSRSCPSAEMDTATGCALSTATKCGPRAVTKRGENSLRPEAAVLDRPGVECRWESR